MGTKRDKPSHVYADPKPFLHYWTQLLTLLRELSLKKEKKIKKEVAAFICYADSAEWWNKKH